LEETHIGSVLAH